MDSNRRMDNVVIGGLTIYLRFVGMGFALSIKSPFMKRTLSNDYGNQTKEWNTVFSIQLVGLFL